MEPTQNLSDFFSNNAQGSGGSPGTSLSGFLDTPAKAPAAQGRVSDVSAIIAQEGADHLKPVIEAIYKQESGAGSNARTSIDGAHGGMQIIPATFQRYAKPGERIDNPDDNMRVGVRIIKDLAGKFGNDPAKIATGYFSGEGNVNGGQGGAWKNDRADGNGKRVSGYVSDILAKVGGISNAQAAQPASTKPDLSKAPKWADIAAKPEFSSLPADKQAQAKSAYFDYYIAPHAGQQAEALRQQFMQSPNGSAERTWGEAGADTGVQLAEGVNTILGAIPNLVAPESGVAGFFNDNAQFWRDKQSDTLKGKINKADQAITKAGEDGVIAQIAEAASQYFQDPALAARFVTTNLPSMIPGIGAAKLAQGAALARGASAARAAQIATTAAGATNAALNAGGARGEAFEDIKRTLIHQGMSPEQAEQQALADSRIVAAVGGIAGYVSGKTGLEKSLFGQATTKGAIKSGVAATATELAGEQLEEVTPQIATNIQAGKYDNRSIGKDVGRTIVETAIGSGPGAAVAGGAAAMNKAPESVSITPDGRIEPTMTGETPVQAAEPAPVDVHPTVQTADAIVRDLATEAGVPLETVLPTAPQATTGPEFVGDQDVQAFAEGRYQQLRTKRDGQIETTVGETGIVDQDAAGAGLSAQEQQELAGLEQARGDVSALRTLYGLDQSIPSDQSQFATQANEAAPATGPVAHPEAGQQFPATMEPGLLAAQENQSENGQDTQLGAAQHQTPVVGPAVEQWAATIQEPAADPASAQAPVGNAVVDAGQQAGDVHPQATVTESEADREARLEREAIQAEGSFTTQTGAFDDVPMPGDGGFSLVDPFADDAQANQSPENAGQKHSTDTGEESPGAIWNRGTSIERAGIARRAGMNEKAATFNSNRGWESIDQIAQERLAKAMRGAPKTEIEARKRKALDRIARGTAYFSQRSKADQFIADNGLADTHETRKHASGVNRFDVVAKQIEKKENSNANQTAQAKQAEAQGSERQQAPAPAEVGQRYNFGAGEIGVTAKTVLAPERYQGIYGKAGGILSFDLRGDGVNTDTGYKAVSGVTYEGEMTPERMQEMMQRIAQENSKPQAKPATEKAAKLAKKDGSSTQSDVRGLQTANTDPFAGNKIFTADKIEAARARLKSKLGTLNSGIDPELLVDGMTIAGGYIESGVRKYSDYAKAMVEDFGEKIRPYLRSFYEAARNYPGLDTTGMTTAAELDLMEKQGTAEHTKATAGMESAIGETVKAPKRTKERKQAGASMLRDDYGVSHIDGYDGSGETSSGQIKTQFLNDTRNYLKDVSKALEARGFIPATARNGKPVKPVSVNESGVAGSGDVTLAMFHPELERGIYIHIGDTALRGVVPSTKSGIAVMMRTTKAGDPWGGDQNRWMPVDMTSAELANSAADAVEKNSTKKQELTLEKPAAVAQNELTAKDTPNANPVQPEPVSQGDSGETQPDAAARNRDSEPVDAGLAADGQGVDRGESVSGRADDAGAAGARGTEPTGQQPSGTPRDRAGVRSDSGTTGADDHVIDADEIGKGGLGQKYRDNVAAIKIIKTLEAEGRTATPEERKALAKYAGWGAMKGPFDPDNKAWAKQHSELKELLTAEEFRAARASTLDAHYTSPVAVGAMYDALARLGVKSGRVLEPSVGVGNFFGLMPREMRNASQLHGVELDSLTSRLVAALYPKAKIAKATGFQDFEIPSEYFDVVIGNPPFGSHPLVDKERSPYSGFSIHNYFLAKSIDKLRPGGVMAIVVSHNFLDAQDGRVRKWIGERASLIGGVRLPNTAFKENAGTEVVTDILIFQKHDKNGLPSSIAPWQDVVEQININPKTGEHAAHKVSQFFVSNPQFVLGKPSAGGTMYSANEYTVEQDGNIKDALAKWVKTLPENTFDNIDRARDSAVVDMAVPDGVKVGSFYVDATGKVMRRGDDLMGEKTAQAWEPRYESQVGRMKGMIAIRDTLRQQMRLERSVDATEQEIEANRAELNRLYDDFLKKYKHLNSTTNRSIFLDDTEAHLIQGLEFDYDKGVGKATAEKEGIEQREASATKADIFQRRVAFPPQDYMTVSTAKDALLASLNYRGRVDGAYMAEVYGKPMDEIVKELGDVVFDDPQSGIVTADEYLSGDVKTKLAEAKAAAQDNAKYRRNVEALEKVIPKDKTPSEISVSIGAAFVPAEIYEQFVKHISGGSAAASYVKATGQWLMAFNTGSDPALNTGRFGTSDLSAQDLFQLTMFGRGAVVKKTLRNADGSTTTILLEKETEAAREKQNAIKAEWQKWLWQDPERADRIASLYNDKMNRIVVRTFDGSHMGFPGMNPAISLLAHQKNGVWRGLQSYQVLYDHVVGAGKTFEMATLAMEMRRLGIARKPVFVVPNHLTLQWRSEFTRLYPGSNILAATPEDFSKDNRERLFAKIITGDWDAVVIGHSSLKKIVLPEKTEIAVLQEQIDELADAIEDMKRARGDKRITADMERIRKNLDAKMKDKLAAVGKRSKMVTFDELGIDAMFIDEMHEFKNLTYNTTMDRNPGMGNPAGSAKAFDLFVKVRWLFDTFGDKTPFITATGTPVSNSLVEMFNMQRYMQYPTLKREGLHVFDAWAKQFGSVENVYEVAPSGSGYRQSTRFAKFTNLPGLMSLYNSFADTITLDDLKAQEEAQGKRFPVPKMVSGRPVLVVAKRSPAVAALMGVPKAQTDEAGSIQFGADLSAEIQIAQDDKTGKWAAKVGDAHLGQFETAEDARLKVVERALTPVVSVDPQSILGRFANLRQLTKETKGKVNALSLTGEANKAGLDYRLIDPAAPDFAGSKINLAVDNMLRTYKQWQADRGTQLVFCDLSIPLSARASYSSKARRLYVRDDAGGVEMKRGTMHALPGHEDLPYFVIQRGEKDAKRFDVYDAASGLRLQSDFRSKQDAIEAATGFLGDEAKRQKWINAREAAGEIEQGEIDEYNNEHDIEVEDLSMFFTREDIAGMSGSAKFSVYDDIKAKLIANGVPEREIAFIHDYSTPAAKDKLFRAVNAGEVRFLLGSTPKMGAGTNVQKRLVGLHHIDAPWRPSDLEQREGRIIRRGNELYARDPDNFEVFIGRYATEQTYDTRRWQILEHKARGIEQLRNYDGTINEIDDIEGEAANAADMKAAASGDPLILEETKLRNDVRRLEQLQAGHADEVLSMTRKARDAQEYADTHGPAAVREIKDILTTTAKHPVDKEGFAPVTVQGGKPLADKEAAHKALASVFESVRSHMIDTASVQYRGLTFKLEHFAGNVIMRTPTGNGGAWGATDPFSPSGMVQRLKNHIDRLPAMQDETQARIEKSKKDAESMRELAKQPFPQDKDLEAAREEHKKIQRALMAKGPEVPESQKAAVAAGMEQQKAKLRELGFGDALNEFFGGENITVAKEGDAEPIPESEWVSEAQFAQVIQERTMQFRHKPPVLIRDSVIDVPHMRQAGAGAMAGATSGGKIYLFRDANATTADVVQTLWHELVHYGLRRFLTKEQYIAQMQKLYDRDLWVRQRAEEWLATDGDDVKQARKAGEAYARARGVDEALAELAETSEGEYRNNTLKAKAIRQTARWIAAVAERFGFHEFAAKYRAIPNDEARALVRSMFQKLRDDAPATSSDWAFTADPAFMVRRIQNNLIQFFGNRKETLKTFGKYDKTLSTQYHKALKDKHYGKVFAYVNAMQNEVSLTSIRPAELAPGVLPRVDDVKSALRGIVKGKHADKNLTQAADAVFAGTLHGSNVMAGKVWSDDELRGKFGMNDTGIALYRQTRAAIDASLDEVAAAEAYAMAQGIVPKAMRRQIIDNPRVAESLIVGELESQINLLNVAIRNAKRQGNEQQQAEYEAVRGQYSDTKRKVEKIFVTAKNLKLAGYAPLMRFGKWTVTVQSIDPATGNVLRDDEGKPLTEYFGKFETEGEAISVRHQMEARYKDRDDIRVKAGVDSQAAHELYAGISPETIALFGEAVGANEVTQKYYQMALSERSALKRRLERKGTAGYSEDLPRVLSNFITSNGRFAAQRFYLRDLNNAIKYIPQEKGDVKDEAMRLKQFILNPNDPAAPVSSVMFAWFLGGSVAAALVNMTQPVLMTGPYLSQHGVATASKSLAKAIPYAMGKKEINDAELKAALKRASQEGIVDAQEIFHLYSVGAQGVASGLVNSLARLPGVGGAIKAGSEDARARINAFLTLWGSMFSLAEGFNRKLTFIAAWDVAKTNKEANPYAFAVRAVNETQGIYNKVNRPNWARNAAGRVILTFKQFSLMYIELLSRMWKRGGPEGKRAALIMLAMLMLASGEEGLPFAQDLDDLIDTIGQMFGLDTNMRRNKRRLAHEILGKTLGDLFLYGVSAQLPIDLSGRLGLGNLIPGTGLLKPSDEQMRGRNVAEIFGPTAGMATQIGDAYDAATEGNPGKALQNLAPKAIKDLMAAGEMTKKGYATDAKGRKVVDVGLGDAVAKGVGFNPTKVAQEHRKTMPIQQDIALQKRTESAIVDQWARGVADGDDAMVNDAMKRRDSWNESNPKTPIAIRSTQIRDRVRQMATEKDARLLKQAPKEMRGSVGLDLAD